MSLYPLRPPCTFDSIRTRYEQRQGKDNGKEAERVMWKTDKLGRSSANGARYRTQTKEAHFGIADGERVGLLRVHSTELKRDKRKSFAEGPGSFAPCSGKGPCASQNEVKIRVDPKMTYHVPVLASRSMNGVHNDVEHAETDAEHVVISICSKRRDQFQREAWIRDGRTRKSAESCGSGYALSVVIGTEFGTVSARVESFEAWIAWNARG